MPWRGVIVVRRSERLFPVIEAIVPDADLVSEFDGRIDTTEDR